MNPAAVLEEIRRRGAVVYRRGDTIRLRPASRLPPELVDAVRRYKAELLPLVPERVLGHGAPEDRTAYDASETAPAAPAPPPTGAWRLTVDSCVPRRGPVALNGCTTVTDAPRCIVAALAALEIAVAAKNAGRERSMLVTLIDEQLATLEACGCIARVEAVQ